MFKSVASLSFALACASLTFAQQDVRSGSLEASEPAAHSIAGRVTIEADVAYASVNGSPLLLDIYEPAGSRTQIHPAVVLIHGGGWDSLDKSTMRDMGNVLARAGFVAFSVNYRLLSGTQNRWPGQLDDVQRAVRWIRANAERYGLDPEHIGAFGHSAGAQLAALLGMEDTRDNSDPALAKYSSRVQAVVDVSGPTDFTTDREPENAKFLANFLAADYKTNPQTWRDASPVFRIAKGDPPFLIIHGTEDQQVPIAQAQEFFEKLQTAGVPASFVKVNGGHTFQTEQARRQLAFETLAFFNRYLSGASSMYALIAKITLLPGKRSDFIGLLKESAAGMSGCLSYLIAEDSADENVVWVTEVWDSQASHDAAVKSPRLLAAIQKAKDLVAKFEHIATTTLVADLGSSPLTH